LRITAWFLAGVSVFFAGFALGQYSAPTDQSAGLVGNSPTIWSNHLVTAWSLPPTLSLSISPVSRGDVQILHNHTILHARSAYEDWPEVQRKRHLLRLWLSPPGARQLPPVFAVCYGGVTIGDRGGIICKGTRLHAPLIPS
jgi:hypothetical protein